MHKRIPCLDGLRAISIIAVTTSHLFASLRGLGAHGVDTFFVISGFLITHLLISEEQSTGTISWSRFYTRRAARIFPAYLLFMLTAGALGVIGVVPVTRAGWTQAATYTYSLLPHTSTEAITHSWSLGVEEHFYLLWPATIATLGFRRARYPLAIAVLGAMILRLVIWRSHINIDFFTLTRIDTIAIGCFAAYAWNSSRLGTALGALARLSVLPTAIFVAVTSSVLSAHSGKYQLTVARPIEAVCVAVVVLHLIQKERGPLFKFLNSRPMVHLGTLSYSVYLAQFAVFLPHTRLVVLLVMVFYALASYHLVEKPVLRWARTPRRRPQEVPVPA